MLERFQTMDHCQSSPILVHLLLEEVERWMVSKYMDDYFIYDDDYLRGYNEAVDNLIQNLK
jgi:hypothetical protein